MRRFLSLGAALCALAAPLAASAQDFAITNATVATGDGSEPVQGGTVVVRGGKVAAAGAGVPVPAGVQTIDGTGKWVTPGLFATLTNLGLWDAEAVDDSNDPSAESTPFHAALDVSPAINPASQHIAISREGGVTRASVAPSTSNAIFAGQGALIDLGADAGPVTEARAFKYGALGENGGRRAGGSRVATSFAKLGPEANATRAGSTEGAQSASTSLISFSEPSSRPLVATSTRAASLSSRATCPAMSRKNAEGGTRTTISAPVSACA